MSAAAIIWICVALIFVGMFAYWRWGIHADKKFARIRAENYAAQDEARERYIQQNQELFEKTKQSRKEVDCSDFE